MRLESGFWFSRSSIYEGILLSADTIAGLNFTQTGRHDGEYDCYGATREYPAGLSIVTDVRCRMLLMRQRLATQGTSPSRELPRGPNFRKIPAHGYYQILRFRSTPLEHCTGLMISCLLGHQHLLVIYSHPPQFLSD